MRGCELILAGAELDLMNVSRILALGGSICHVLRGFEALGWHRFFDEANRPGGSAKEGPHVRGGSELGSYEDLMNVSRILALGGSICPVLGESGGLGGSDSNHASVSGGSAKEGPHVRGGSELGSYEDLMNVLRM